MVTGTPPGPAVTNSGKRALSESVDGVATAPVSTGLNSKSWLPLFRLFLAAGAQDGPRQAAIDASTRAPPGDSPGGLSGRETCGTDFREGL